MTTARERAAELIAQSDRMPWSPECGALLLDAAAVAEAGGEDQLGYTARMRLVNNSSFVHDSDPAAVHLQPVPPAVLPRP